MVGIGSGMVPQFGIKNSREFPSLKTALFFGKRTTMNTEGRHRGTPDVAMLRLHISCTMRANGSFAIRGNAEFFSCRMRKCDKG